MGVFTLDLVILQGATFRKRATWKSGPDAVPVNLTGYTAEIQFRSDYGAEEPLISLTTENGGITLGGESGTIDLYISANDTAAIDWTEAIYQMELTAPNGDVLRKLDGRVTVSPEVVK